MVTGCGCGAHQSQDALQLLGLLVGWISSIRATKSDTPVAGAGGQCKMRRSSYRHTVATKGHRPHLKRTAPPPALSGGGVDLLLLPQSIVLFPWKSRFLCEGPLHPFSKCWHLIQHFEKQAAGCMSQCVDWIGCVGCLFVPSALQTL